MKQWIGIVAALLIETQANAQPDGNSARVYYPSCLAGGCPPSRREALGNDNHLPITRLERKSLFEAPTDKYEVLQNLVERRAEHLALVIARDRQKNADLFDALSYSIREVMRNVFEHSQAPFLYYCAQYWPTNNKVEFAIADFGIGIRRGLS